MSIWFYPFVVVVNFSNFTCLLLCIDVYTFFYNEKIKSDNKRQNESRSNFAQRQRSRYRCYHLSPIYQIKCVNFFPQNYFLSLFLSVCLFWCVCLLLLSICKIKKEYRKKCNKNSNWTKRKTKFILIIIYMCFSYKYFYIF